MIFCDTSRRFTSLVNWSAQATLLLGSLLLSSCGEKQVEKAAPPPGVLVQAVAQKQISDSVKFIGRTTAINDVSVRARVEGYLLERSFEEGGDINKGDLLFKIDPETYEAALAAAKGSVAEHQAALVRAEKDLVRYKELGEKAFASQQDVDKAESDKLQAAAQLQSAEARVKDAEINLEHTNIIAPIDGRIGRAVVSVGNLVDASTGELAHVVELDPIYATFNISEKVMLAVRQQHQNAATDKNIEKIAVRMELPNGALYDHKGVIDFADNQVNRRTGAVVLRARFDNPKKLLVPGINVLIRLSTEKMEDVLVIPQAAVQEDQSGKFVLLVDPDNKVEMRQVKLGRQHGGDWMVTDGLQPGEKVIIEGVQKVRAGMEVAPKQAVSPFANEQGSKQGMAQGNTDEDEPARESKEVDDKEGEGKETESKVRDNETKE
jgi:membrane fusion protein (multidrug efflux system)